MSGRRRLLPDSKLCAIEAGKRRKRRSALIISTHLAFFLDPIHVKRFLVPLEEFYMAMALFSMPMQVRDARTGDVADKFVALPCAASVTSQTSKQQLMPIPKKTHEKREDRKRTPHSRVCSWG